MTNEQAIYYLDNCAGEARGRYMSCGYGQESTYIMKAQQAKEYKDLGYPVDYIPPFVQAEADATGLTPQQSADSILTFQYQWTILGSNIERIRRTGKVALENNTDPEAIAGICQTYMDQLNAI